MGWIPIVLLFLQNNHFQIFAFFFISLWKASRFTYVNIYKFIFYVCHGVPFSFYLYDLLSCRNYYCHDYFHASLNSFQAVDLSFHTGINSAWYLPQKILNSQLWKIYHKRWENSSAEAKIHSVNWSIVKKNWSTHSQYPGQLFKMWWLLDMWQDFCENQIIRFWNAC